MKASVAIQVLPGVEKENVNIDLENGKTAQGQNISQHFNNDAAPQQWILKNTNEDNNNTKEFNKSNVVLLQKWLLAIPNAHMENWKAADLYNNNSLDIFDICLMKHKIIYKTS